MTRRVLITILTFTCLTLTSPVLYDVMPLFLYTPSHLGGMGFTRSQVSEDYDCVRDGHDDGAP